MNHRIEGTGPTAPLNVDVRGGIAARGQRPDDIIDPGRIDVVVNDDGETILVAAGKALRRDHAGLLHVTGITLLDGNDGELPRPRFVRPDAADFRHAGFLQFFPHMS